MDPTGNDASTFERHLFQRAEANHIPIYGVLELLPLCNLRCDMCYIRMDRKDMESKGRLCSLNEWLSLAEEMKKAGTLFLLLTGGEPLLYPDFKELYTELQKMGMILTLNTNGTLINKGWADFFATQKPRRINITLYGASNETYESLCHVPNGFDHALNGIRLLKERGIDVKINGSLAKTNLDDRMKIIEIGEHLDIPVRIDTYMYPSIRERSCSYNFQSRLDPETAAKARINVLHREMGEEIFTQYAHETIAKIQMAEQTPPTDGCMTCRAGKSSFVINWQGHMRPCVVLNEPDIPVLETGFQEAWNQTITETKKIRVSKECTKCKYRYVCNNCPASAIAECGSYDAVPDYICRYTKTTVSCIQDYLKDKGDANLTSNKPEGKYHEE